MYEDGFGRSTGKGEIPIFTTAIRVSLKSTSLTIYSVKYLEHDIIFSFVLNRFHSIKTYYQSVCESQRRASERNTALLAELSSLRQRLQLAKENASNHLTRFTSLKVRAIFNTPSELVIVA